MSTADAPATDGLVHDLPEGMVEWIAETGGGTITHLERHVARREAWVVDITRPDGSVLECFLRLDRHDHALTTVLGEVADRIEKLAVKLQPNGAMA